MTAVDAHAARARAAFETLMDLSREERAGWLVGIAAALTEAAGILVDTAHRETHLPVSRLSGELKRTTGQLELFARAIVEGSYLEVAIDHANAEATPPLPDLRRMLMPLGPVAVYAASNFPFAFSVAGGDTASALAAGCPVIVKAHPGHPETSRRTAGIVHDALSAHGAPTGAFGLVEGFEEGIALIENREIAAASFTGSLRGGRALADRAAQRAKPIPFFGEFGSVNPVVVTRHADATRGAELAVGLAASFTLGAGQFCTNPGLVFVPDGSVLERHLRDALPVEPQPMLTDGIGEAFVRGAEALSSLAGVRVIREPRAAGDAAVYAMDIESFLGDAERLQQEVFGPATLLVNYSDEIGLKTALGMLEGSLTATLHFEDGEDVGQLVAQLQRSSGRLLFEGWPTGVAVSWAQNHGGPWPSTNSQHTSVGVTALRRFLRPIAFQDAPQELLPVELRDTTSRHIPRRVDGKVVV